MSGFGQDNDNITRNILLQIDNEEELTTAAKTSARTWEIYNSERFWCDRLELYYPKFVADKSQFPKLKWREFYRIISLFHAFRATGKEYGTISFVYPKLAAKDKLDEDNFVGDVYYPTSDIEKLEPENNIIAITFSHMFGNEDISKHNLQIADQLGKFLYERYSQLNLEVMFSERFICRLLLKGRICREFDAYIYSRIIETMLNYFQEPWNDDSDSDVEFEEKSIYCPEVQFIFQINNRSTQTSGLFEYIDEGLFP